ncbi:hypothetical protein MGN70_008282 [Eutypa lata]|nr:hypothetical protein MGN70_008282 [Eutypa lata]
MENDPILQRWFPWTTWPWIFNAPMFTVANGQMAVGVTKAGGIGMVPAGIDPRPGSPHIAALDQHLTVAGELLHHDYSSQKALPVGVGFTTLASTAEIYQESAVPLLVKHKPAFVWLFGSDPSSYGKMISLFHSVGRDWDMKVFAQVGTVEAALQAASIMTLVPEVIEALQGEKELQGREIPVIAAGGIVNGKGVAAAMALGASGITMGTRVNDT